MKNRFNVEIKPGFKITFHTTRGEVNSGIVEKLYRMSGYGWCAQTSRGSCHISDIIKSEPVRRYSVYIKYGKARDFTGGYLSHKDRTEWSYRTAKKHLRDVIREKLTGDKWVDVWHFSLVEA